MAQQKLKVYSRTEEAFNIYTHAFGVLMGVVATILFVLKGSSDALLEWITALVFGLCLVLMFSISTAYHATRNPRRRMVMNILDHSAIYILIAGTYTPFTLVTMRGTAGLALFIAVWSIALFGVILKTRFTGRFRLMSTIIYIAMGWIVVFAIMPLYRNLPFEGLAWLFAGGLSYTIGAILYGMKKIPFNHAIFHVFVLGGSFTHIVCVYQYIL